MALTKLQKTSDPEVTLIIVAPSPIPTPGTELISSLQWNNLIDILDGISTDKIVQEALVAGIDTLKIGGSK